MRPEGFYYLMSLDEPAPCLVHGYYCTDDGGRFVYGFNTHDGGGMVRHDDLDDDVKVEQVKVCMETVAFRRLSGLTKTTKVSLHQLLNRAYGDLLTVALLLDIESLYNDLLRDRTRLSSSVDHSNLPSV